MTHETQMLLGLFLGIAIMIILVMKDVYKRQMVYCEHLTSLMAMGYETDNKEGESEKWRQND